jgi:type I restriction enzyme R subunit
MGIQQFEPIAITGESTVVAQFDAVARKATSYQSEAELETAFIDLLKDQAYTYLPIVSEASLIQNLRVEISRLNKIEFSDIEWERFFREEVASDNDGIVEKTRKMHQGGHIRNMKRDDGSVKNITLIDKNNIHNNSLQVINQYEVTGTRANRYDVTILVNGLPMVHVELKRRGVDIREAFNQINRYQRDSFWAGSGLFQYVQLFVISNGTLTKYYSNSVRKQHLDSQQSVGSRKTSNSYEFTSWWADANNKRITDLMDFGKTFFSKHSILNILTRYCVMTSDDMLLVMRPYQIVATERVLQRILVSSNSKNLGTIAAGGYIWHTTGSGKTLTSFKTAQLASAMDSVDKVLFVVDRKDLDYQTMKEYDRFQPGAADSNVSTAVLTSQLGDANSKIIITTIQKLSIFIARNPTHAVTSKRVVLIFDECHRSQFGDMHTQIKEAFKNYNLFGFTGTPIFAKNAASGGNPQLKTTEQAFGERLHEYTIVDAIEDKNVLPFRVDYVNTISLPDEIKDKQVSSIETEKALLAPARIQMIVEYIRYHFDQKTRRSEIYKLKDRRVRGFNSIFATASIEAAKRYYLAFQDAQKNLPSDQQLKIGLIYSFATNEEDPDGILDDEGFDTTQLDKSSRDFLDAAIKDYNQYFSTNWDTSADNFQSYYKDLALKLKNREIDLVIVVNMFLTGFDATTLNTLWVDKNLRQHGLLQAFSRTNRILNSVKTYGNIVCFRNLDHATEEAISLFGNKEAGGIVLLRPYLEYFTEYSELVNELASSFEAGQLPVGGAAKKDYVELYNKILRLKNILVSFDDFEGNEILTDAQLQDYHGTYLEIYRELRDSSQGDRESILDSITFEIELVKSVDITVDYILALVAKMATGSADENKEIKVQISKAISASVSLQSKKDLIERFVDSVNTAVDIDKAWRDFVEEHKTLELQNIIETENLNDVETRVLLDNAFRNGQLTTAGSTVVRLLPPKDMFSPQGEHGQQKIRVIDALQAFFDRFFGL